MQSTNTYLELLHERGIKGLPLERVYRQLFNKSLYLTAYGRIYRNAINGNLPDGPTSPKRMDASAHWDCLPGATSCLLRLFG